MLGAYEANLVSENHVGAFKSTLRLWAMSSAASKFFPNCCDLTVSASYHFKLVCSLHGDIYARAKQQTQNQSHWFILICIL